MYPLHYLHSLQDRKRPRASRLPSRAGVTLNLEALEDRWLPNATIPPTSTPPPSFTQAAIQLFSDGVNLGKGLVNQHIFLSSENTSFPVPLADLNADIAFNSQFVGGFAPLFVLSGEMVGAQVQFQTQSAILQSDF